MEDEEVHPHDKEQASTMLEEDVDHDDDDEEEDSDDEDNLAVVAHLSKHLSTGARCTTLKTRGFRVFKYIL